VIFVKDMLFALLALVAAIAAAFFFYTYTGSNDNKVYLAATIVFALATIILGGLFLSGRVNKKEEIHITE
jgi:CDP-diglyceride synthetase